MRLVRLGAGGDPNWVNWVECAVVRAPLRVRGLSSSPALVHNNAGAPLAGETGKKTRRSYTLRGYGELRRAKAPCRSLPFTSERPTRVPCSLTRSRDITTVCGCTG